MLKLSFNFRDLIYFFIFINNRFALVKTAIGTYCMEQFHFFAFWAFTQTSLLRQTFSGKILKRFITPH